MIEYLEQLLEEMKNEEAIRIAEQILRNSESTPREVLAAQVALLRARADLNQCEEAIGPGLVAREMAREMEEWDYYGAACFFLGYVHGRLRNIQQAIEHTLDYLEHLPHYQSVKKHEFRAWYNLGIFSAEAGDDRQAVGALSRSLEIAEATGDQRVAHGVRQALAQHLMRLGQLKRAQETLVKCGHYLRHHPDSFEAYGSRLFHLKLRAEFALQTNRLNRAVAVCIRGLRESQNHRCHLHYFHMVLATVARREGRLVAALGHATSAKTYASMEHRFDLEIEASNLCYELISSHPDVLAQLDGYYLGAQTAD